MERNSKNFPTSLNLLQFYPLPTGTDTLTIFCIIFLYQEDLNFRDVARD